MELKSFYLLMPLCSSLLFVFGVLCLKRAGSRGVGPWTVTFVTNLLTTAVILCLLGVNPQIPDWNLMWQPVMIAGLYIVGQVCTFSAIHYGDVSIATPLFSTKVLWVAGLSTVVNGTKLGIPIWLAAFLAMSGVILIQTSGVASKHQRVLFSITFALSAAFCFASFDTLLQSASVKWQVENLLPVVFVIAAVLSLGFIPFLDNRQGLQTNWHSPLFGGAFLIALQAMCLVYAIGKFGDTTRINIVYTLRGLWGVVLPWIFARWLALGESKLERHIMARRLVGAVLVMTAVMVAISYSETQGP